MKDTDKKQGDKSLTKKVRNILINKLYHLQDKDIFERLLKEIEKNNRMVVESKE